MNEKPQQFVFVPYDKMEELMNKIDRLTEALNLSKQSNSSTLGDYISEKEAKTTLNKGSTWFWNKRKAGELKGHKAGGEWYYKKSEILNFIENGKTF